MRAAPSPPSRALPTCATPARATKSASICRRSRCGRLHCRDAASFEAAYLAKYGYRQPGAWWRPWIGTSSPRSRSARQAPIAPRAGADSTPASFRRGTRKAYFPEAGGYVECAVIDRSALPAIGEVIEGPAIIEEAEATTLLLPRATASVSPRGHLVMTEG